VTLSQFGKLATIGPTVPAPDDEDDDEVKYGAVIGKRLGRGNRSPPRKSTPVPLRPPQIPHQLTWD
jgi:hypothetical protein